MKIHRTLFASFGILLLLSTALIAQEVKTDYDRSIDFSQYKTYSWEKVQTQDPLWVNRIKEAVNAALTAKGWTPVESGGDVAILAMEMTQNHRTLKAGAIWTMPEVVENMRGSNTYYDGFGGGWRWGGGLANATTTVDNYKVGTLVVDLFDAKTRKIIWRGSSSDTLSDKSDKNIKNLDKGVQKMFHHFPPDVKK